MKETPSDSDGIFVGWALLPVAVIDGQECPSYNEHAAIDVSGLDCLSWTDSMKYTVAR